MSIKAIKSLSDFSFKDEINANENGLCLKNYYLPDEVVMYLLTFADGKDILNLSLVCKRWYVFVRSRTFWCVKYEREYRKKAKNLPWFVYYTLFATNFFDTNLLKNNCGKEGFNHWKINKNYGDAFKIEKVPFGCKPLPDVKDFDGYNSCFVTSYYECNKEQIIKFDGYKVFSVILDYYRPDIYVSEWVAGRSDCGCLYTLRCTLKSEADDILKEHLIKHRMEQRTNGDWKKMEMVISGYPKNVKKLIFEHEGQDTQFWKGHYGSKMAGGVVKILFNSIEPKKDDIFLNNEF